MRKPNLFIVGAPKCGTTAWASYLSTHPDVFFAPRKEPHYFSSDFPNFRWARSEHDYLHEFAQAGTEKIIGEASVNYLYSTVAAKNIANFDPGAKILILLRSQETFLPSYHQQLLYNRDETVEDFEQAWTLSNKRNLHHIPSTCREEKFLNYKAIGKFTAQVRRFLDTFPSRQVKILRFEKWTRNPRSSYREVLKFLDIEDDGRDAFDRLHTAKHHRIASLANITQRPPAWVLDISGAIKAIIGRDRLHAAQVLRRLNRVHGYKSAISDEMREEIRSYYLEDNEALEKLLSGAPSIGEKPQHDPLVLSGVCPSWRSRIFDD